MGQAMTAGDWAEITEIGTIKPYYDSGLVEIEYEDIQTLLETKDARHIAALLIEAADEIDARLLDGPVRELGEAMRHYSDDDGTYFGNPDRLARHILDAGWVKAP
jgi:hypothetical protein